MTDNAQPTTEAGRRLLDDLVPHPVGHEADCTDCTVLFSEERTEMRTAILAIEAEARAESAAEAEWWEQEARLQYWRAYRNIRQAPAPSGWREASRRLPAAGDDEDGPDSKEAAMTDNAQPTTEAGRRVAALRDIRSALVYAVGFEHGRANHRQDPNTCDVPLCATERKLTEALTALIDADAPAERER